MSCTLNDINVSEKIKKAIEILADGSNPVKIKYARMVATPEFVEYINNDKVVQGNLNSNINSIVRVIREFANKDKIDINSTTSRKVANSLKGFTSTSAIDLARIATIDSFVETYYKFKNENKEVTDKDLREQTLRTFVNNTIRLYKSAISSTGGQVQSTKVTQLFAEAVAYAKKTKDVQILNNIAAIEQIKNNYREWFDSIKNNPRIKNIYFTITNEDVDINADKYETKDDEVDNEKYTEDYNEDVDQMTRSWADKGGEYSSYLEHMDDDVRIYFERLKYISSAEKDANGRFLPDEDNELGMAVSVSYNDYARAMYEYGDYTNVDKLVQSLERTARNIYELRSLAIVARDIKDNPNLANKLINTFGKPKMSKIIITILPNAVRVRQSNNSIQAQSKLQFDLLNSLKNTALDNYGVDFSRVIEELNTIAGISDNLFSIENKNNAIDLIYKTLNNFYPTLTKYNISAYVNSNGTVRQNINKLIQFTKNTIANVEKINQEYFKRISIRNQINRDNKARIEKGEETIPYPNYDKEFIHFAETDIINFAKEMAEYVAVKTELNSRNAEGNLSSDVLNNNFISNLQEKLESSEGIEIYKQFKTKGNFYKYSNILYEHKTPNGETIPGLFIKNEEDGSVKATSYAAQLLSFHLFNGIADPSSISSVLYNSMSPGDYFLASVYSINASVDVAQRYNKDITFGTYFLRTPSDAPKNFMVSAPVYNGKTLFKSNRGASVNEITNRFINAFNDIYIANVTKEDIDYIEKATDESRLLVGATDEDIINLSYGKEIKIKNYNIKDDKTAYIVYKNNIGTYVIEIEADNKLEVKNKILILKDYGINRISPINEETNRPIHKDIMPIKSLATYYADTYLSDAKYENSFVYTVDRNHVLFHAYKNVIKGQLLNAVDAYRRMFKYARSNSKNVSLNIPKGMSEEDFKLKFHERYFYNGEFIKDGKPTGNVFNFSKHGKLRPVEGYDLAADMQAIAEELYEYALRSNIEDNPVTFDVKNNSTDINFDRYEAKLDEMLDKWLNGYRNRIKTKYEAEYSSVSEFKFDEIFNYVINATLMNINYDDILEGAGSFYKDAQTFLKRTKEVQASGNPLATNRHEQLGGTIIEDEGYIFNDVKNRNGFVAVTIKNVEKPFKQAERIYKQLIETGSDEDTAAFIASKYGYKPASGKTKYKPADITTDDAQSYITLDEFIRRIYNKGELNKYIPLLNKLKDENFKVSDLNPNELKDFIQVQKHFYYDIQYDEFTNVYYPRQIKNAEFVLVPAFIKDTNLEKLNNWMQANGIDQVNTAETSKAANKQVIDVWDENGELKDLTTEEFTHITKNAKGNYYYQFLYEQQKVPQHMINAKNKAGIQIMKKLIDNLPNTPEVQKLKDDFFKTYTTNIKVSFDQLLKELDLKHTNGRLEFGKDFFEKIYGLAEEELGRLGLDSNMYDYVTLVDGQPVMPNFMNLVAGKMESIAQAIFNSRITRQKLPGWHAAQVTNVLYGGYVKDANGNPRELEYHPDVKDENGNIVRQGYAEVLLPKWASTMFNQYDKDGNLIKEITIDDVDDDVLKCIGYRIPTEGKQSVSILKVVGFLPEAYGSTIVLPESWVAQTGADFDVDSVYGISYETYLGSDGRVHKVEYLEGNDEADIRKRYNRYLRTNGVKVEFTRVTEEEKDGIKESIKATIDEKYSTTSDKLNEELKALIKYKNSIVKKLPEEVRTFLNDYNINNKNIDFRTRTKFLSNYINTLKDNNEDEKINKIYDELIAAYNVIIKAVDKFSIFNYEKSKEVNEQLSNQLQPLYNKVIQEYYSMLEKAAEEKNLLDFDTFSRLSVEEQNIQQARNNHLLDIMIKIMSLDSSLEENYSSSNFKDLIDANKQVNEIDTASDRNRSIYDPFDQIAYMNDAMSGAKLKAFSVTRDTFNSVNNVAKTVLDDEYSITVIYDLNETDIDGNKLYNVDKIKESYGNNAKDSNNAITVKHNMLGWSSNNRNIVGKLLTPYSSETTAHILDAIKEGAVKNENDYTFAAFKTLVDVGIDYKTAIMFLRQPAISRVVNAYNNNKSIFVKGNFNPIHAAIKELAVEAGIKIKNGKSEVAITQYSPIEDVIKGLNQVYGVNYSINSKDLKGVRINAIELKNRFGKPNNENIAFDYALLIQFNKLMEISNNITNIARVCNPDRFGAKQSINATRKILETIKKYNNPDGIGKHFISTSKEEMPLLEAIYPNSSVGEDFIVFSNTNVMESVYPSLAAFLKYSTVPSTIINKELFATESPEFLAVLKEVASVSDKSLSDKTYNMVKKYIISNVYANNNFIKYPIVYDFKTGKYSIITSDDNGLIDPNTERNRIFGYYATPNITFKPKDFRNLTTEEFNQYLSLSPAQKVTFIKKYMSDENNIFAYIDANLSNSNLSSNGFVPQTITFNENNLDKERAYQLFRNAYYNRNPLVKYAAIDIIKYAFMIEGYNFKRTSISKIIPNDAMLDIKNENNFGFIDEIIDSVNYIGNINTNNLRRDFVRSNSTNKEIVTIYNSKRNKIGNTFEDTKYNAGSGILKFSIKDNNEDLIKFGIVKEVNDLTLLEDYITISRKRKGVGIEYTLYKTVYASSTGDIYLYPLNILENNEHGEFSANPSNNKFNSEEYYQTLIDIEIESGRSIIDYIKSNIEKPSQEYKDLKERTTFKPLRTNDIQTIDNTYLEELAEDKLSVKTFINDINNTDDKLKSFTIINNSNDLKAVFNANPKGVFQTIVNNKGESVNYYIKPSKVPSKVKEVIKKESNAGLNKLNSNEKELFDKLKNTKVQDINNTFNFYQVTKYEKDIETEVFSTIGGTLTPVKESATSDNIIKLAKQFNTSINRDANVRNSSIAAKLVADFKRQGINFNSTSDIADNIENILTAQAEYVKDVVNTIFDKFENMDFYDIPVDDPSVIEKLDNDNFRDYYIRLILNANNFAKAFDALNDIEYKSESPIIQKALDDIKRNIDRLKVDNKALVGNRNIMLYLADKFSTDPRIKEGFKDILEEYGDADFADWLVSDIAELDNSSVQVVVKKVLADRYAAISRAKEEAREFAEKAKKLRATGRINDEHIIKDGAWVKDYDEKVYADLAELRNKRDEIEKEKGRDNVEWHRANLDYELFKAQNFEQPYNRNYYIDKNNIERTFLDKAPDYYVKYKSLSNRINELNNIRNIRELSIDEKKELHKLYIEQKQMRNNASDEAQTNEAIYRKTTAADNYKKAITNLYNTYFDSTIKEGFKEKLKHNLDIINKYESAGVQSFQELMRIREYAEAYDWIQENTYEGIEDEFEKNLRKAEKYLSENTEGAKTGKVIPNFRVDVYDDNGKLRPELLNDKEIADAKNAQLSNLNTRYNNGTSDASLMKATKPELPSYNNDFYSKMPKRTDKNPERLAVINEINEILINYYNEQTNQIITSNFSLEHIRALNILYARLDDLSGNKTKGKEIIDYIKRNGEFKTDDNFFNIQKQIVANKYGKNSEYYKEWLNLNAFEEYEDGATTINPNRGNSKIYGYIVAKDEFIDKEKTEAIKFIRENVEYVVKPEYYETYQKALEEGLGDAWLENNTIVNPITKRREPLRIWMDRRIKEAPNGQSRYTYKPSEAQIERSIRAEYENTNYVSGVSLMYNHTNPKYNKDLGLTEEEKEYRSLVSEYLDKHTKSFAGRKFITQGNLPRRRIGDSDVLGDILKAPLEIFGLHSNADNENGYKDVIDYAYDVEPAVPMLEEIKAKGWKKYLEMPERAVDDTDETYAKKVEEVKAKNAKIKEYNRKISLAATDTNWDSVIEDYIISAMDYNARQEAKLYLYVLLDSLKANDAYKLTTFGNVKRDYDTSLEDAPEYKRVAQTRTIEMVETFIHRFIYDEYKKPHRFNRLASVAQNVASAKYMMFNVTGGIGNVLTGWNNIHMETIAKTHFTYKEWAEANTDYIASLGSYFMNLGTDKANNLTDAIIKEFDVVDFTQIIGQSLDTKSVAGATAAIKNLAFAPQSMGERYMQNSVLIAMLKNNKLYTDSFGNTKVVNYDLYTREVEEEALVQVLQEYPELLAKYKEFIQYIKGNRQERFKYITYRKHKIANFIKGIKNKEVYDKYVAKKKEMLAKAKEDFNKLDNIYSQYELVDGYAKIKPDSKFTKEMFGEMKSRVISVNNKIHGVYNKLGAARIEAEWWGGMVMQYHKHLYPGFMKRFRRKAMYNEVRQSFEKGAYQSFFDFLTIEFKDNKFNSKGENKGEEIIAGIQHYARAVVSTVTNAQLNWNLLEEWEKANIKRTLADFATAMSAVAFSVALFVANDDDKYEDSLLWNLMVYQSDRLASESLMYTPMGIMSEGKKLWSSPLAIGPSVQDIYKSAGLIANILVNGDEFDPYYATGRYAGENKLAVYITRNIPMYRAYKRIEDMDKNNSYYKLGENIIGAVDAKGIAESISDNI